MIRRLKVICLIFLSCIFLILQFAGPSAAFIEMPSLDMQTVSPEDGLSGSAGALSMNLTVLSITLDSGSVPVTDVAFALTGTFDASNSSAPVYSFTGGSFAASDLLAGEFDSLTIYDFGNQTGQFFADLIYTGGSLSGDNTGGRIEGILSGLSGDISGDFSADTVIAALGPVVPIPAAGILLASGLFSLLGVHRFMKFPKN